MAGDEPLPYELLLNLTGHELSGLNARATLREVAADAAFCGHETFLHLAREVVVDRQCPFEDALRVVLERWPGEGPRVAGMRADGYLNRCPAVPGSL